jgi:cyanate permease
MSIAASAAEKVVGATSPAESAGPRILGELPQVACWINVLVAAMAMLATIPGRVYGLAPITESLLRDFEISRTTFGMINLWATLVVAVLSVGFGTVITRYGMKHTHLALMVTLAGATALLTVVSGTWPLFVAITLARILGQGVLALLSTSLVAKSFPRGAAMVMAVFAIAVAILYAGMISLIKLGMSDWGMTWREVWLVTAAVMLFGATPLGWFAMSEPRSAAELDPNRKGAAPDLTIWEAMRSPVFILFGLSCLLTGTANAGVALFNESVFKDRGLSRDVFFDSLTIGIIAAVVFKLAGAWLCHHWSMGKMAALSVILYGLTYFWTPVLQGANQAYVWSIVKSLAFSVHYVIYFAIWSYAFGRRDVVQIQGAAHVVTITASGLGPVIFGVCRDQFGSYDPCMYVTAVTSVILGVVMWFVPVPCAEVPPHPISVAKENEED